MACIGFNKWKSYKDLFKRRSNQSFLKGINSEYSLEYWPPNATSQLTGKDPDTKKGGGQAEKGAQGRRCLDDITDSVDMNLGKLQKIVKDGSLACCSPQGHKESDMNR